ncbi:hypothetical protein JCM8547_006931 [Rhodosporidiobolus lusitaniae]
MSSYVSAPTAAPSPLFDKISAALPFALSSSGWSNSSIATAVLVVVITLLLAEQSLWRYRKQHLPGHSWQIPVIGQFAESLNPTMEAYKRCGPASLFTPKKEDATRICATSSRSSSNTPSSSSSSSSNVSPRSTAKAVLVDVLRLTLDLE